MRADDVWRAVGLADIARRVIRCHVTQKRGFKTSDDAVDDAASNICQALPDELDAAHGPRRRVIDNKHSTEIEHGLPSG